MWDCFEVRATPPHCYGQATQEEEEEVGHGLPTNVDWQLGDFRSSFSRGAVAGASRLASYRPFLS